MLVIGGLALLYIHSYPPFRMNCRGAGEVPQMLGVGGILPLFDLVPRIGFGIEDILFVAGLGMSAVTALLVFIAVVVGVKLILAAPVIMLLAAAFIMLRRPDLLGPGLAGGGLTLGVYVALSLVLQLIIPGVFALDWNAEEFLNVFFLGTPVEELVYGFAAGLIGSGFPVRVAGPVRLRA